VDGRSGLAQRGTAASALSIAAGLTALGVGFFLAGHHPLWPMAASVLFALWTVVAARWRGLWLLVLPATLPVSSLSPWTGWLTFDEFDLLVLGALAGGFARHYWELREFREAPSEPELQASGAARAGALLALAFVGVSLVSLVRGLIDAHPWSLHWFDGYADASNSVRVSKSWIYASAFWSLLKAEFRRSPTRALRRFALGMQLGLTFVGLAVLWERAAYPGLLDFSVRYRTTAAFWEMHVGGGAIDA
jgi:energy-coupling factor transporter transmembrane protein EcfT